MCLYPRLIKNKKFTSYIYKKPIKGNSTSIECNDHRKLYVPIGCGHCIECRKEKARNWQIRLMEELKVWKYKYFVTLTFSEENLKLLCEELNNDNTNVNTIARLATRRFLERWRKKYKKSVKHWLITELGHDNTERIHLHGIIFDNTEHSNEELQNLWKYGWTYTGEYCNERTINYIVKYVTKIDIDHKGYEPDIFCSGGIGKIYTEKEINKKKHLFCGKNTIQYYTLKNGQKISLPIYYRNKFWTQDQRDLLWTYTLDADRTYVRGIKCNKISSQKGYNNYLRLLEHQQKINTELGYGSIDTDWNEKIYTYAFIKANKSKR